MKALILAFLLAAAGLAHAEVITLDKSPCTSNASRSCQNIGNAAGLDLDYYAATNYLVATMYVDGVPYLGPNTPSYSVMTNSIGQSIIVQVVFSSYRTCTHSGRGQTCTTHWTLEGGTLTR